MAKKCKKCGTDNPSDAHYCGKCGAALSFIEYEVVPKGTRQTMQGLETKYVSRPTIGTGVRVLYQAISKALSRFWNNTYVEDILLGLGGGAVFLVIIFFSTFFPMRNSVDKYSIVADKGLYALYKKDKQLTPYQYDTLILYPNDSYNLSYVIARYEGKYGRLNRKGQVLDSCIYESILPFSNGWAVTKSNGLYGFIKEKKAGKIQAIKPQFKDANSFRDGFAWIRYQDNLCGWIDKNGNEVSWGRVVQCGDYNYGWAWTTVDAERKIYEFVDKKGKHSDFHATNITYFNNNRAFIERDKGWAMLDSKLSLLTDFVLSPRIDPVSKKYLRPAFPYDSENKRWLCSYNGKDCFVDKKGQVYFAE